MNHAYFRTSLKMLSVAVVSLVLCLQTAQATSSNSPVPMLQNAANQIIALLKKNPDPRSVRKAVNRHLVPLVDKTEISKRVIGMQYWNQATSQQRAEFIEEMAEMVVGTYSTAFTNYKNEQIKFLPLRGAIDNRQRILVKSWIIKPDGHKIWVNYRVFKRGNQWKIYDFSVDGLSLIESYRAQFERDLRRVGLAGLIQKLKQHNDQN